MAVEVEIECLAVELGVVIMANSAYQTCYVVRPVARLWRGQDGNQRRACIILSQQGNGCKTLLGLVQQAAVETCTEFSGRNEQRSCHIGT